MDSEIHYSSKFFNTSERSIVGPISGISNSILESIAKFFNVSVGSFDIYNYKKYEDGFLILVHYNTDKLDNPIEGLRGPIIFVSLCFEDEKETEIVKLIVPSGPIIEQLECEIDNKGNVTVPGLEFDNCSFSPSFEGLNLRIFKFRSEVFFCTFKTLYAANKIWGNSVFFGQMWENDMNIPFDIFPPGTVDSKYCHSYFMVHRDLQYSSQFLTMNKGFVVYHGATETGFEGHKDEKIFEYDITWPTYNVEKPFITNFLKFNDREEASDYLKYGLYKQYCKTEHEDHWELNPGEKVLMSKDGKYYECLSPSSCKRREMREKALSDGINTSLDAYFDVLSRVLNLKTGLVIDLRKKNPVEVNRLIAQQKERYMRFFQPIKLREDTEFPVFFDYISEMPNFPISTPDILKVVTEYYIWLLPPFIREQNKDLLKTYYNMIEEVADWIFTFRHNNNKPYIADVILKTCDLYSRERQNKTISLIHNFLHESIKYALDMRNLRGEEAIPSNIRYLLKRNFAYEVLKIFQLKIRYDIANTTHFHLFKDDYSYLVSNGKINYKLLWSENINKLYPLHKKIYDEPISDIKIEIVSEKKQQQRPDKREISEERTEPLKPKGNEERPRRIFNVEYGKTYKGQRKDKEEEEKKVVTKKITTATIIRKCI